MDISGNALVIGGGSGIGRACALGLAKEGATGIVVGDIALEAASNVVAECRAVATNEKFRAEAMRVNVTDEASVRTAFERTVDLFGRLDYCVNCAGIGMERPADIASLRLTEFQKFMDVNTTGTFLVTREASVAMRAQKLRPVAAASPGRGSTRGAIVNLCSASSMAAAWGVLPYTTSKHASLGLTKNSGEFPLIHASRATHVHALHAEPSRFSLSEFEVLTVPPPAALDNAAHSIRVNCVCPSWTDTPMVQRAVDGMDGLADMIKDKLPVGRMAIPEEIADVVIFALSPRSSFMTGSAIVVDGGLLMGL